MSQQACVALGDFPPDVILSIANQSTATCELSTFFSDKINIKVSEPFISPGLGMLRKLRSTFFSRSEAASTAWDTSES